MFIVNAYIYSKFVVKLFMFKSLITGSILACALVCAKTISHTIMYKVGLTEKGLQWERCGPGKSYAFFSLL